MPSLKTLNRVAAPGLLLLFACGGDGGNGGTPAEPVPNRGTVQVEIATTGVDLDLDGHVLFSQAALVFLLIGCGDQPVEPAATEVPSLAKPSHAGGGTKGASAGATLQGGMNAAPQTVSLSESSGQLGISAASYTVTMNLGSLVTDANIGACRKEPTDIPDAMLQVLRDRLASETHVRSFSMTVDKQAALAGVQSVDNGLALRDD